MSSKIALLDFGSQYAHLGARRLRALGVYTEILDPNTPAEKLRQFQGIILSGGPDSVYEDNAPTVDPKIFELQIPILGICYGHQLMTHLLGGKVEPGHGQGAEFGKAEIEVKEAEGLFSTFQKQEKVQVWMSHGDRVTALPKGFKILASSEDDPYSAIGDPSRNRYGIQFHPEVVHTLCGNRLYQRFIELCGVHADWNMGDFVEHTLERIKEEAREKNVFMLISGGVDSTVAFVLLSRALGPDRVHGLLIDTGFMRQDEVKKISERLKGVGLDLHVMEAQDEFFKALEGVTEPEEKREIIGRVFLEVQKKAMGKFHLNPEEWMLGQGTIYPDTIETGGSKHAAKIKTHHNRVPEITALIEKGLVMEPLKELYKDEVRQVGEKLGLPKDLVWRHPFPGPGLAVRILCAKEENWPEDIENLNRELNEFLKNTGTKLTALVLPIQSVGVQGDFRTYRHPVLLQGETDWPELFDLSPRITNQFHAINRVLYGLTPDHVEKVTMTPATLSPDRVACLQKADQLTMDCIRQAGAYDRIWQCPTILIPLSVNTEAKESLVLRPVESEDVMTAHAAELPWDALKTLKNKLLEDPRLSAIFYDVTNKPPGTIEWE